MLRGCAVVQASLGRALLTGVAELRLLCEGLVRLLAESGHRVAAVASDGPGLLDAVVAHRPDVSIVDVRMPSSHTDEGLRAAVTARAQGARHAVLVLSQYVEVSYADDPLKDRVANVDEFLEALRALAPRERDVLARMAEGVPTPRSCGSSSSPMVRWRST